METKRITTEDERVIDGLISDYGAKLTRYCFSILCNYSDADDAVQITLIKVFQKRHTLKQDEALPVFLFKTAYRTSIDIIRKRRLILLPDAGAAMEGSYLEGFDRDVSPNLIRAMKSLSPLDRALIYDRAVDGMHFRELSGRYGKSETTLRKRYERARKRLAAALSPESPPVGMAKAEV